MALSMKSARGDNTTEVSKNHMAEKKTVKPLARPGYTMFNNFIIDHFMPNLSPNGWKVLCVAIRQTIGWVDDTSGSGRKEKDRIAYSQFLKKTGIKSSATLNTAIQENLDKGYLLRDPSPSHAQMFDYYLNQDYEIEVETSLEIEEVEEGTSSEIEEVGKETSSEIEAESKETSSKIEDTKERKKVLVGKKEEKKESGVFQEGDDYLDVAAKCEAARQVNGNYAVHTSAGGDDAAAKAALVAMYDKVDSEPPQEGTRAWDQEIGIVSEALQSRKVIDPDIAKKAGELFGQANRETPQFVNPRQATFPSAFGLFVGRAKKQAGGVRRRRARDLEVAEASQAALRERQAARSQEVEEVEDDKVGMGVKNELEVQMSRATFHTYVRPTSIILDDGVLRVTAPDEETKGWLENRLATTIQRTAVGVVGHEIEVVIAT